MKDIKEIKSLLILLLGTLPVLNFNASNTYGYNPLAEHQAKKTREEANALQPSVNTLLESFCEEFLDNEKVIEWVDKNKDIIAKHKTGFGGMLLKLVENYKK